MRSCAKAAHCLVNRQAAAGFNRQRAGLVHLPAVMVADHSEVFSHQAAVPLTPRQRASAHSRLHPAASLRRDSLATIRPPPKSSISSLLSLAWIECSGRLDCKLCTNYENYESTKIRTLYILNFDQETLSSHSIKIAERKVIHL